MDRLTYRDDDGIALQKAFTHMGEVVDRLADYEDAEERVELVRVVLCADCKQRGWIQEPEHGKSVDYCRLLDRCVDKQFFCAAGERNCGAMMDGEG